MKIITLQRIKQIKSIISEYFHLFFLQTPHLFIILRFMTSGLRDISLDRFANFLRINMSTEAEKEVLRSLQKSQCSVCTLFTS